MLTTRSFAFVAAIAGLAHLVAAAPDYHAVQVGCQTADDFDPYYDGDSVSDFPYASGDRQNGARCATACGLGQGDFSPGRQWTYGVLLDDSSDIPLCFCSDWSPVTNNIRSGEQSDAYCEQGDLHYWTYPTTFYFRGCYDTVDPNSGVTAASPYLGREGVKDCMSVCRYSRFMSAHVDWANGIQWGCYCSESSIPAMIPAAQCDENSFYAYEHDAESAASGFAKRQLRQQAAGGLWINGQWTRRNDFCPHGLTACNIPNTDHFECIDTREELESCGGCAHGQYKPHKNESIALGVNCVDQPGIRLGGTTCAAGKCRVSACQDGWILANGECKRG